MQFYYLTLKLGNCTSSSREIVFRYPLKDPRSLELYHQAIGTILQYPYFVRYYWSLVTPDNHKFLKEALLSVRGFDPEEKIIPIDIMHGLIGFRQVVVFNDYSSTEKEELVNILVNTGIQPADGAMDYWFVMRQKEAKVFGWNINQNEREREVRSAFRNRLEYCNYSIIA